jgi:glucose/arabinose dehydrogenase
MNHGGKVTQMFNSIGVDHRLLVLAVTFAIVTPAVASAQLRAELVAQGLSRPVAIVPDPTDPKTLFIVNQPGTVTAVVNGAVQATPFLDLSAEVKFATEQGLLGLAFAADNQRLFVHWVKRRTPDAGIGDVVISRFRRSTNPLVVDPASRFDLVWPGGLRLIQQPTDVHKGGNVQFGPDGYLYLGLGDGGGGGDPVINAQNPSLLLGKMLRIDINVPDSDPRGYRVPANNPFVDGNPVAAAGEIWSVGWRNPWRWSFDDIGIGATGALIVGDVGQDSREEIDYEPAGHGGRNYGWYMREGTIPLAGISPLREPAYLPFTEPILDYPHTVGRAVTGGYVYRGGELHSVYRGRYFVADFYGGIYSLGLALDVSGEARVVDVMDHTLELGSPRFIPTFGRGLDGELYFSSLTGGRVFKIVPDTPALPAPPEGFTSRVDGSSVSLEWRPSLSGGPVLGYRLEVGSATGLTDLLVTETLSTALVVPNVPPGRYVVRVRGVNSSGTGGPSAERVVRVGCGGALSVPAGVTANVIPGGEVKISWSPLDEAISYLVEAGSATGLADLAAIRVEQAAVNGVVPPGTYYVRVRAVTACGISPSSEEIRVTVP